MTLSAPHRIPPSIFSSEHSGHGGCHTDAMNHSPPTPHSPSHDSRDGISPDKSALKYSDQYLGFKLKHDSKAEDTDPTLSLSMHDKEHHTRNLSPQQLRSRSPTPTPSPRSSSASLVITEGSANEGDSAEHSGGHTASRRMSRSFETLGGQRNANTTLDAGAEAYSPKPLSKVLLPHQLSDIKEEKIIKKSRRPSCSENTTMSMAPIKTEKTPHPSGSHEDTLRDRKSVV